MIIITVYEEVILDIVIVLSERILTARFKVMVTNKIIRAMNKNSQ